MFALKQVSLMALLIALTYAAPQLDLEENAKNINTADYINVRDRPSIINVDSIVEGGDKNLGNGHFGI